MSLVFSSLITVYLDIDFFGFILFRVNVTSCIYKFIPFLKFGELSAVIFSNIYFYNTFSSTCEYMFIWILDLMVFPIGSRGSVHFPPVFFRLDNFYLYSFRLTSSLLSPFCCWTHPVYFQFSVIIFKIKIFLLILYYFYFLKFFIISWVSLSLSICFISRVFTIYFLENF